MKINFTSQIELIQHFQQYTGGKRSPSIVVTGSCIGYVPNKNYVAYHICKNGLIQAVKAIRSEDQDARISIVNPATVRGGSFFSG